MKKYKLRNGKIVEVKRANEVQGCLLNPLGDVTFRIYKDDGHDDDEDSFTDYALRHSDPWIKFVDSDVYFYFDGDRSWVDHSPATLGLEEV